MDIYVFLINTGGISSHAYMHTCGDISESINVHQHATAYRTCVHFHPSADLVDQVQDHPQLMMMIMMMMMVVMMMMKMKTMMKMMMKKMMMMIIV
jgi:hypothetical protein